MALLLVKVEELKEAFLFHPVVAELRNQHFLTVLVRKLEDRLKVFKILLSNLISGITS